jgi:hypothetical protein
LLGNATTGSGQSLVTFDPAGDDTRLLTDPSIEYLNTGALRAAREAWFTCLANASMYRQRAEMMMGDDPNLAVLAETQSRKQVSKISRASEKDATGALKTVAKTNVEALERFERTLGAPPPGGCGRPSVPRTNSYWRASTTPPAATGPASPPKASSTTCSRTARRRRRTGRRPSEARRRPRDRSRRLRRRPRLPRRLHGGRVAARGQPGRQAGRRRQHRRRRQDGDSGGGGPRPRGGGQEGRTSGHRGDPLGAALPFLPKLKRGVSAGAEAIKDFLRASGTAARGAAAAEAAAPAVVATMRPRATRAHLQGMLANTRVASPRTTRRRCWAHAAVQPRADPDRR